MTSAGSGDALSLAAGCVYRRAILPTVSHDLIITGNGATLKDSGNLTASQTATLTITSLNFRRTRIVITQAAGATITGGTFTLDTALNGGAIDDESSSVLGGLQVTGTTFTENTATSDGGAILGAGNRGAVIADCAFYRNHAAYGGAIEDDSQGGASITGTLIAGNTAAVYGGGVASFGDVPDLPGFGASISDSVITGNHAVFGGGGVYSTLLPTRITGTLIARNTADGDGGGAYYDDNELGISYPSKLTDDTITRNYAAGHGGGVYDNLWQVAASGTTITRNTAGTGGGGIYLAGEWTVTLTTSPVTRNRPDNCEPANTVTGCTG